CRRTSKQSPPPDPATSLGRLASLVESLLPERLGTGFRWLLGSSWLSNLGDGIVMSAGPLLVASQTNDPFLVSLAFLLQMLPWLLFGLIAGALADRWNRKRMVVVVDLVRAGVLGLLGLTIATDTVSIVVVLATLFVLGTAEVFADTATSTLLPSLVARDDLAIGNARVQTGYVTLNMLVGPPIGAFLFATGMVLPFVTEALLIAGSVVLVSRVALTRPADPGTESRVRQDIAEGFRWVVHHAAVRTLVLTIFIFNITYGAAWSVLVLYARDHLGMGEVGFGLLTTVSALGGLVGTATYGWITKRLSLGDIMRIGLIVETLTHLALALTSTPWVAMLIFFVFGAHAFIWGTTSSAVRQRAVPNALQGRVASVNGMGVFGGLVFGAGIGGVIADHWGLTGPFWFAFVGSAVFVVAIWKQLAHIAHADQD
ncbi:MAG: major facilitator superfamily 1, partial [Frankiales bacterium]|nr:major facilitator superfamily 1 [Frankiales bacterium]